MYIFHVNQAHLLKIVWKTVMHQNPKHAPTYTGPAHSDIEQVPQVTAHNEAAEIDGLNPIEKNRIVGEILDS